ncbi:MAG: GntR family transcriptional regulator [Micrococcaceae bacterium]
MSRRGKSETLSTGVRDQIRKDILAGHWRPGQNLQLVALSKHYETSSTVVREALARLSGDRLVELKPNRGFFVSQISTDELQDFNELRCRAEEFGIQLAIERGDLQWESEVFAAHHMLERTPRFAEESGGVLNPEWVEAHDEFHKKMLSACQLPVLINLASVLADENSLHRRWSAHSDKSASRDMNQEHREILQAVLDRNAPLAGRLLREHYTKSMDYIVEVGFLPEALRP